MKYRLRCKLARLRGALGRFGVVQRDHEAPSAGQAVEWFKRQYETNGPPVEWWPLEPVPDQTTDRGPGEGASDDAYYEPTDD